MKRIIYDIPVEYEINLIAINTVIRGHVEFSSEKGNPASLCTEVGSRPFQH